MLIENILQKAQEGKGLEVGEITQLFCGLEKLDDAAQVAAELKSKLKGNVASLYTCLYITNSCLNDCGYCGYRNSNEKLERITLTSDQIIEEAREIKKLGVSNVILIGGTMHEEQYLALISEGVKNLFDMDLIPWIEFENLSSKTLRQLSDLGANHFVLFQETYDKLKYERVHRRSSLKGNYRARLGKVDEAIEAGFSNINIGALFGLGENYLVEIIGLFNHAKRLQEKGANVCISLPTLKPAPGLSISPHRVSDFDLERAYLILKLALPDVSFALSGRENEELRNRLFRIVDQIGSGGVPNPGGRTVYKEAYEKGNTQFTLCDKRWPQEIIQYLIGAGIEVRPRVEWRK